jgi:two-component sensor histidine kinase/PAS domain-containing protein
MDFKKYSVTWKVTGMFLLVLLVSFAIHVILIVPRFTRHSENYARNMLEERARGVADSIDRVLEQARCELEKIARHPEVVSMEPARIDKTLLLLDEVTANFLSIWVQDEKGIVISRPDKTERVGADLSDMAYFIDARSTGRTVVSDFFISTSGNLTTTMATPLRGSDGPLGAILVGSLGIDERNIDLFRPVTDVSIGKSGFAYLVDGTGKLIAHPEVSQTRVDSASLDYRSLPYIKELVAGKAGSSSCLFKGEPCLVGYAPVSISGWGVVVQEPRSEIPDYSGSLLTYFLSIFAAMFVVSGMLSVIFARHLLRPLKLLGQTAGARVQGLENGKVRDEIQILSSHIGEMVEQIKISEMELKKINKELEEEIAQRELAEENLSFNLAILDLQLERSPEGVLVVDTANRIISYNQRFKNIWGLPDDLMEARYDPPVLEFVQRQMVKPEAFVQRIRYLYQNPLERSREELHLLDGRILERHSEPMVGDDGTYYGRVWYFRDITDQKRSENEIRHALQEKETLLKEVHHRVKNNLQAVSSILDLQSAYLKDGEAIRLCRDSKNRILTMALLHENLYRGQDQTKVELGDYVSVLTDHLLSSMEGNTGSIKIKTSITDLNLNVDTAIPCGLIVTELVSNSIKHAFPEGAAGVITVEASMVREGEYQLVVSDDGVGLPDDWTLEGLSTLGLQLVSSLTNQLSGTMEITSGSGITFTISFREYTEYHGVL